MPPKALRAQRQNVREFDNLTRQGGAAFDRADWLAAFRYFSQAARLRPRDPGALSNQAIACRKLGRTAEAEKALRGALVLAPQAAGLHYNLGTVLEDAGRDGDAADSYQDAIRCDPGHANAHLNLGSCLRRLGRAREARAAFIRSGQLGAQPAAVAVNLGNLAAAAEDWAAAAALFREALAHDPSHPTASERLAIAADYLGHIEEARSACNQAQTTGGGGFAVMRALTLSRFPDDCGQIAAERKRMAEEIAALDQPLADNPHAQTGPTIAFPLAYHGQDDRAHRVAISDYYRRACPALAWTAPDIAAPTAGERIRIGFLSEYMRPNHTIGRLFGRFLALLPRDRFEVVYVQAPTISTDSAAPLAALADRTLVLADDLPSAREAIARERLHVLHYPDIGMGRFSYFLAHARLAPVQTTTYGHPVTSGIPNLDFYLSMEAAEPEGAREHYTETLVQMPCLPNALTRPTASAGQHPTRAALGLPEGRRLYVCAQTLFKLHPDFDEPLAAILRADPQGVAVFINMSGTDFQAQFRHRIERRAPDIAGRLLFVGPYPHAEFLGLCAAADVMLDTFHFSGGNSTFEALAAGAPVVTLPGAYMRGRVSLAYYEQMGVRDLVATDADHFARLAVQTATDRDFRADFMRRAQEALPAHLDDRAAPLMADFFEAAARGHHQDQPDD